MCLLLLMHAFISFPCAPCFLVYVFPCMYQHWYILHPLILLCESFPSYIQTSSMLVSSLSLTQELFSSLPPPLPLIAGGEHLSQTSSLFKRGARIVSVFISSSLGVLETVHPHFPLPKAGLVGPRYGMGSEVPQHHV